MPATQTDIDTIEKPTGTTDTISSTDRAWVWPDGGGAPKRVTIADVRGPGLVIDDLDDVNDSSTRVAMAPAERTKLSGIEAGAQVNRSLSSQEQAEAGSDNATVMTPLRTSQAIAIQSTHLATAETLVKRDAAGRFQAAAPEAGSDVATRAFAEGAITAAAAILGNADIDGGEAGTTVWGPVISGGGAGVD